MINDILLLVPCCKCIAIIDQCMLCHNDILFNLVKSVCAILKSKAYKLYLLSIFIDSYAMTYATKGTI